jgi:probable HAF family extracellular repeat protein
MTAPYSFVRALALCAPLASLAAQAPITQTPLRLEPRFKVLDLNVGQGSTPTALSDRGHVTGLYFGAGGERRAFLWTNGVVTDLGSLGSTTQAFGVNDSGVAVGNSVDVQGRQRAIRAAAGTIADIGTLHGGIFAAANDVNAAGHIAGMSQTRIGNAELQRATLWRAGQILDLGTFGGEYSEANALNDVGQVVGWAWYPFPQRLQRAFLWSSARGMIDLGSLAGHSSIAHDVNNRGEVVGSSVVDLQTSASHGFLWTEAGGMVDLGLPPGTNDGYAVAINEARQIVGNALFLDPILCFRVEPLLWEGGTVQLLNHLIDPDAGWTLVQVSDINDRGEIVGNARNRLSSYRAVKLVPLHE